MNVVNILSQKGHTIIMTIHQPSSQIYNMMAKNDFSMMVLESGRTMYLGTCSHLVTYLTNINYKIPKYSNPCDYILDLVNCNFQKSTADADYLLSVYDTHIKQMILDGIEKFNVTQLDVDIKPKSK
eukprot:880248_1